MRFRSHCIGANRIAETAVILLADHARQTLEAAEVEVEPQAEDGGVDKIIK